jgi:hypothetical protein
MVDEEKRLRKQGTLTGKAASAVVGAGAGFTGAWEPLKRETGVKVRKQSPAYRAGWIAGHAVPVPLAHAAKGLKVAKAALRVKKYSKGKYVIRKPATTTAGILKQAKKVAKLPGPVKKAYKKVDRLPLWRAESSIAGAGGFKKGAKSAKIGMDTKLQKLFEKQKVAEAKLRIIDLTQARKHIADEQTMRKIAKKIGKRRPAGLG